MLIILNSLSIVMAIVFLFNPPLCVPLTYAIFTFAYNTTRLGISYSQVRAVRLEQELIPTPY